jgi:hypothetical protein
MHAKTESAMDIYLAFKINGRCTLSDCARFFLLKSR